MKLVGGGGGGGYTFSAIVRRPQVVVRHQYGGRRSQCRNESTTSSPSSSSPSTNETNTKHNTLNKHTENNTKNNNNDAPSPSSSPSSNSSPASTTAAAAGSSIPPIPEPTSRSLRQIIKASAIGRAGGWYSRAQDRRPYWTQMWSTLFVYLCSDLAAQSLFPPNDNDTKKDKHDGQEGQVANGSSQTFWERYDPVRTMRHLTVGLVAFAPVYKWFMFLHHNFNFASTPLSILTKVAVSQACFTPTFNVYFFSMQSLLAGASIEDTWERLKKALPTSLINSVKLWPTITAFMFLYVDPQFRSIFSGVISVGWQTYLSWLNQKAAKAVREAELAEQVQVQGRDTVVKVAETSAAVGPLLQTS